MPDLTLGVCVAALGVLEATMGVVSHDHDHGWLVLVALAMGLIVALCRAAPGAALAVAWAVYAVQLACDLQLMLVELAVVLLAFGCARWGRVATVWLSGVSIPLSAAVLLLYVRSVGIGVLRDVAGYAGVAAAVRMSERSWAVIVVSAVSAVLGLPWLAGLAFGFGARARSASSRQLAAEEAAARAIGDTVAAREVARLREQQAELARDVHDVVGHSLAVILAQAESAQFLDDTDSSALKATMANVATTARSSLQDVRQVLSSTGGPPAPAPAGRLDALLDGLRASGHDLTFTETGSVQPLPPDLDVVVFRVMQEMLTNAIKHGRRGGAVRVERHWEDGVQIEVRNLVGDTEHGETAARPGHGLAGMRRRLEAVGGHLEVLPGDVAVTGTFTVRAWLPVR